MARYAHSLAGKLRLRASVASSALLLFALVGCDTPETPPISYPCKNLDPRHFGPGGVPDPCHFEDPDSPAQAVKKFFDTVAGPFCDALYACCTDQMFLQDFTGGSLDACKATWTDGGGLGSKTLLALKTSLVNGTTVFDGTQLDACVTRLNTRLMPTPAGAAACVEPAPFVLLNTCFGAAFLGQTAPGGACETWPSSPEDLSFAECQDGRCENGRCVAFLKSGDTCHRSVYPSNPTNMVCDFVHGEWCRGLDLTGTCSPRIELGDACDPSHDADYLCKSMNCADQQCLPLVPDSTACNVF